MERLKKAVGLILLVSFSLCFISVPAFADKPWADIPPGKDDDPVVTSVGPRGKGQSADLMSASSSDLYRYSGLLVELSYQLAVLMGHESVEVKAIAGSSAMRTR